MGQPEHLPNSKNSRTTPEPQDISEWKTPEGTLGELTAQAWSRSATLDPEPFDLDRRSQARPLSDYLRGDVVAIIAEIKRRSPSRGDINPAIDSATQAGLYEAGGASALSVLTEPHRFGGSDEDILRARSTSALPILKKDFHVSEAQLHQAARLGVSAALIIVRAIEPSRLGPLAALARELALELLFEVRDERELERALAAGAGIIGVNNRNLETLQIDLETVARILPLVPPECIAVAESGYSTRAQVEAAAAAGADAVLVGSSLSAAPDPSAAVRAIVGVERRPRGS